MWKVAAGIAVLAAFFWGLKDKGEISAEVFPPGEFPAWSPKPGVTMSLNDLYKKHANRQGLDWLLLKAIAQVESNENPNAVNPADPSRGLMQILCVPDKSGGCANKFNILGWPPESEEALFDPDLNLSFGSQILAWNITRYGFLKGIAVYNSWSARNDPMDGPFRNQGYVDKVLSKYRGLGGIVGQAEARTFA